MKEIKLLSIVTACFNRRQILLNTLKSINYFKQEYPIEVIIVDDTSREDQQINDVYDLFPNLNLNLIVVKRDPVVWRTPVVAYNMGFNIAKGDVILINGVDSLHLYDIIGYIFNNFEDKSYFNFSAYKGWSLPDGIFNNLNWNNSEELNNVYHNINTSIPENWHIHSKFLYCSNSILCSHKSGRLRGVVWNG